MLSRNLISLPTKDDERQCSDPKDAIGMPSTTTGVDDLRHFSNFGHISMHASVSAVLHMTSEILNRGGGGHCSRTSVSALQEPSESR